MIKVGILTSGGNAPGMNAVIETVVKGLDEAIGFKEGFKGLCNNEYKVLRKSNVDGISSLGGTILQSSRYMMKLDDARDTIKSHTLTHLVVVGGNGSYEAAKILAGSVQTIFIPATIDNDVDEFESIGFDTALNSALENIDRIKDCADSHNRKFVVEVMGNKSSKIAYSLMLASAGIALIDEINHPKKLGQIAILAENQDFNDSSYTKVVLGHTQRGGRPSARDRMLARIYALSALSNIFKEEEEDIDISEVSKQRYGQMLKLEG